MTKSKRPLTLMIVNLDEQEEDELEGEEGGNNEDEGDIDDVALGLNDGEVDDDDGLGFAAF